MFHTSHLSTVETLPTLVVGVLWRWCFLGLFLGFGFCFCVWFSGFRFAPLTNMQSFHPSHDDLGTLPTWRPYSCQKKKVVAPLGAFLLL